jgi:transcriptional regulator with XRE-family HTH domain
MLMRDMDDRGAIGKRVREARKLAHLRVAEVAAAVQRLPLTVYRWEVGKCDPSLPDCRVVALLCNVSYAWLVTGEGRPRAAA